ncbi:DUF1493 family protein [Dyadobacter frigoris]|uniref:DUF1493 family protein n=1 Tax=Dyadobacter frigoris TaxID=2576211 RepID=A0A4U6D3E8_9BACT|nr:DUF1493 family protein [Dyadobacter frigoris]TKT90651.1 DUF1493 family protein [Dyadobacter frigoris]
MDTLEILKEFIIEDRGKYAKPFSIKTTLEKDLGITGDDTDEFMDAFFKKFNIHSEDFDTGKYFHSEGFDIFFLSAIIRKFTGAKSLSNPIYDITLGDLVRAIEAGTWIDPKL